MPLRTKSTLLLAALAGATCTLGLPAHARTFQDWCLGYYESSPAQQRTIENIWTQVFQNDLVDGVPVTMKWREPPPTKPADAATFAAHCARLVEVGRAKGVSLSFFYGMAEGADCDFTPIVDAPWVHGVSISCQDPGLIAPEPSPRLPPQPGAGAGFAIGLGCGTYTSGISDRDLLATISRAPHVQVLRMSHCKAGAITAIGSLGNLLELELTSAGISDVRALSALVGLRKLDLSTNEIRDVSPLMSLVNIASLDLSANARLEDIWSIRYMVNLTELNLGSNSIVDLTAIEGLTWLKDLDLSGNQIVDVRPVATLRHVRRLLLYSNKISDVSALKAIESLKQPDSQTQLGGNPVSDDAVQDLVNAGIVMYEF